MVAVSSDNDDGIVIEKVLLWLAAQNGLDSGERIFTWQLPLTADLLQPMKRETLDIALFIFLSIVPQRYTSASRVKAQTGLDNECCIWLHRIVSIAATAARFDTPDILKLFLLSFCLDFLHHDRPQTTERNDAIGSEEGKTRTRTLSAVTGNVVSSLAETALILGKKNEINHGNE
jgi:hypothetical protein